MKSTVFGFLISLAIYSPLSNAVTLEIDAGELTGAKGVIIGGISYDVSFISQSCLGLFSGCTNFLFGSQSSALAASTALEQQVFNDSSPVHLNYDTNPQFTTNITSSVEGYFLTPYVRVGPNGRDVVSSAFVNGVGIVDSFDTSQIAIGSRPFGWGTYAYWTVSPVPLPAAAWLFGSGILALAGFTNLRKSRA